jgi:hypothetical protein
VQQSQFRQTVCSKMADEDGDVNMNDTGPDASEMKEATGNPNEPRVRVKKWNAVALWAWSKLVFWEDIWLICGVFFT